MTMQFFIALSICVTTLISGVVGAPYYGKTVGPLSQNAHIVSGDVYLVDESTVRIRNFNYDGLGPATAFYIAFDGMGLPAPAMGGTVIPDPSGETTRIRAYTNADILLKMPTGKTVRTLKWLSVWCNTASADFGSIQFPANIRSSPPEQVNIGVFNGRDHQVSSGDVILVDSKTIKINNLRYDGAGPDAFFLVGTNPSDYKHVSGQTPKVPDENKGLTKLNQYSGQTITIKLPDGYDIIEQELRWLSIYCIMFGANFGEVNIPANVNVIPFVGTDNCEQMNENFQVIWQIAGADIQFEFVGKLADDEYMAFGLSGSESQSSMDNADVVVAYYKSNQAKAVDYNLNQRAQCSGGDGACPDSRVTGAVNSVSGVSGSKVNGITRIKFTRKLNTGDATGDKIYSTSTSQYIAWALGRYNGDEIATKHSTVLTQSKQLMFGRTPSKSCTDLQGTTGPPPVIKPWDNPLIKDTNVFDVTIGPSGGDQGYSAITGNNAWGIAYYVNGMLIPRIRVESGQTYTFRIQTGNTVDNQAKYHPFYITSDSKGGHKQRTTSERAGITIYAGLNAAGDPLPTSVGPLCEYQKPIGTPMDNTYTTFDAYKAVLTQNPANCAQSNGYSELKWQVPDNLPANTIVYYQCWTHNWLGWKIFVNWDGPDGNASSLALPSIITMIITICLSVFK